MHISITKLSLFTFVKLVNEMPKRYHRASEADKVMANITKPQHPDF
ncbi:hypothetical protein [Colwellia sp. 75C3]|nr:hypothetical protein [Colwellia sp. 75C3]